MDDTIFAFNVRISADNFCVASVEKDGVASSSDTNINSTSFFCLQLVAFLKIVLVENFAFDNVIINNVDNVFSLQVIIPTVFDFVGAKESSESL